MCWWICVAWCYIIWVGNWVINEVSDLILCTSDWFFKVGGLKYTRFTVIFVSRTVLTTSVSQSLWWCLCIAPEQPSFFCKESIHWVLVVYISEIWTWHLVHIYFSLRIVYSVNFRMATVSGSCIAWGHPGISMLYSWWFYQMCLFNINQFPGKTMWCSSMLMLVLLLLLLLLFLRACDAR